MFDVGFSELLLIGLVALLVLGPEKLPGAARTAGLMIGKVKRSFNNIRNEVEREIGADELRRKLHSEELLKLRQEVKSQFDSTPTTPSNETTASSPETVKASLSATPEAEQPSASPQTPVSDVNDAPAPPDAKQPRHE